MPFEKHNGTWHYVPSNRKGLTFKYTAEERAAQKALEKEAPRLARLEKALEMTRLMFALQESRLLSSECFYERGKGGWRQYPGEKLLRIDEMERVLRESMDFVRLLEGQAPTYLRLPQFEEVNC